MVLALCRFMQWLRRPELPDRVSSGCFYGTIKYRTKDGLEDYVFSFEQQPGGTWRAYIVWQPDYNGRNEDAIQTHRLSDGDRRYVCWKPEVSAYEACRRIAALWADNTQQYRKTGHFPM